MTAAPRPARAPHDAVLAGFVDGLARGTRVGVALQPGVGVGLAVDGRTVAVPAADPVRLIADLERTLRPRWTWWGRDTCAALVVAGLRVATCWDLPAVHQLLHGGSDAAPDRIWAGARGLAAGGLPTSGQLDLLGPVGDDGGDPEHPVRADGYLRPEWTGGGWRRDPDRLAAWAATALACAAAQHEQLVALDVGGDALRTALSESATALLCAELEADGLPVDRVRAEQLVSAAAGDRPRDEAQAAELRSLRDAAVLDTLPSRHVDLRNPAQLREALAGIGISVPDTRSWRLKPLRTAHPAVEALLQWRKAERIATTYGYAWLDASVRDGRLRGGWQGSDGAAGRMTAQAGLHNLPAELRPAVAAEPGYVFVRADLGQIEPRVLAVVSGDPELARAATEADLYAPVAARLGVERAVAKVAVLAAMYGQTSGTAGAALRGLQSAYPVAMGYLDTAYERGRVGRDVRTHGGRLVRMPPLGRGLDEDALRAASAARGRYARNAVVQGAAAEFFKTWAVTVRARGAALDARIVLCLHDELLVHTPREHGPAVVELLRACLDESAARWQDAVRGARVRFVAEVDVVARWSDVPGH